MQKVVSIHNLDHNFNDQWFFSTDHCQKGLSDDWVPVTHYNKTYDEIRKKNSKSPIIGSICTEIENPNPLYKVNEIH